jgi:hypothetical protein
MICIDNQCNSKHTIIDLTLTTHNDLYEWSRKLKTFHHRSLALTIISINTLSGTNLHQGLPARLFWIYISIKKPLGYTHRGNITRVRTLERPPTMESTAPPQTVPVDRLCLYQPQMQPVYSHKRQGSRTGRKRRRRGYIYSHKRQGSRTARKRRRRGYWWSRPSRGKQRRRRDDDGDVPSDPEQRRRRQSSHNQKGETDHDIGPLLMRA